MLLQNRKIHDMTQHQSLVWHWCYVYKFKQSDSGNQACSLKAMITFPVSMPVYQAPARLGWKNNHKHVLHISWYLLLTCRYLTKMYVLNGLMAMRKCRNMQESHKHAFITCVFGYISDYIWHTHSFGDLNCVSMVSASRGTQYLLFPSQ